MPDNETDVSVVLLQDIKQTPNTAVAIMRRMRFMIACVLIAV